MRFKRKKKEKEKKKTEKEVAEMEEGEEKTGEISLESLLMEDFDKEFDMESFEASFSEAGDVDFSIPVSELKKQPLLERVLSSNRSFCLLFGSNGSSNETDKICCC